MLLFPCSFYYWFLIMLLKHPTFVFHFSHNLKCHQVLVEASFILISSQLTLFLSIVFTSRFLTKLVVHIDLSNCWYYSKQTQSLLKDQHISVLFNSNRFLKLLKCPFSQYPLLGYLYLNPQAVFIELLFYDLSP